MSNPFTLLALPLALVLTEAAVATPAQEEREPTLKIELLADATHAVPGGRFELGLRFEIPEHWHIYWENPGDTGLATQLEVHAPAGFEVGRPVFPGPERFVAAGDLVSYGYEKEVLIFVPITAPTDLVRESEVELSVDARWLVCREGCFLQSASTAVVMPTAVRSGDHIPAPANREVFQRYRARLPRSQAEIPALATTWSGEAEAPVLTLELPGADALEFFPLAEEAMELTSRLPIATEDGAALELRLDARALGEAPAPTAARGVLRVTRGPLVRFHRLSVVHPGAREKTD